MQNLPVGISEFKELRTYNCLYVDKTKQAYSLLTKNRRTFLSRPRRFGKSLFVSMLEAALQGEKELFKDLWIAESDYGWEPHGVIRLDFSLLDGKTPETLEQSLCHFLLRTAKTYEVTIPSHFIGVKHALEGLASALFDKFGKVALLIDEYDYPILQTLHAPSLASDIRSVIREFSTAIKALQTKIHFVFVTGVSAFSKSGFSSGLNNLLNLTMLEDFFDICGYTEEEVDRYFLPYMEKLAQKQNLAVQDIRAALKSWYNGYCFNENTPSVYNPFSLTNALHTGQMKNFWFESATPQFLLNELAKEERGQECDLLKLDEIEANVSLLQTFEIEYIPLLSLLFQAGYLTLGGYNKDTRFYRMKYPNLEVKEALHVHLMSVLTKTPLGTLNEIISKIVLSLMKKDIDNLVLRLTEVFSHLPYQLSQKHPESFYHSLVQALFIASGLKSQAEYSTPQGRADIVVELKELLYIFEIKVDESPQKALKQIEQKKYYEPFLSLKKPILLVGLCFRKNKNNSLSLTFAAKEYKTPLQNQASVR